MKVGRKRTGVIPKGDERGIALIVTLWGVALLFLLGIAFLSASGLESTISTNQVNNAKAFWYAEGGLEEGFLRVTNLLKQNPDPDLSVVTVSAPVDPRFQFSEFQVTKLVPGAQRMIDSGPYQGLASSVTSFEVLAEVTGPNATRRLSRNVDYLEIPFFQFGVFYGKGVDLEIAPGPPMTFNGRVHSNSNVYLHGDSASFDSWITTTGNVYRYVKRDPSSRGKGNPQIKDANGVYQVLDFDHEYDHGFSSTWTEAEWMTEATATFGGKLQDSAMDILEIIPPIPDTLYDDNDPDGSAHLMIEAGDAGDSADLQEAKLYYEADVIITDPGAAKDQSGSPISLPPGVVTTQTFFDGREQANIQVLEIDVGALVASGESPANGVLYVHNSGANKGVRLVNASELPAQGLTVVTENPVYMIGDYNTVDKKPAAVIADAITVLSSNWDDSKGDQVTSNRPATATTVNAAFALGPSAESVNGQGNGQLENLIRFLEDWKNQTFTYNGSLVALWHSQQATGNWRCCGDGTGEYYNAPDRDWSFDTDLINTVPPGSPTGRLILRGTWRER